MKNPLLRLCVQVLMALILILLLVCLVSAQCHTPVYHGQGYGHGYHQNYDFFTPKDVFLFLPTVPVVPAVTPAPQPAPQPQADVIDGVLPRRLPRAKAKRKAADLTAIAADLRQSCIACHKAPSAKGGVSIFTRDGEFNDKVSLKELYEAVQSGSMPPPPRPGLNREAQERLRAIAENVP